MPPKAGPSRRSEPWPSALSACKELETHRGHEADSDPCDGIVPRPPRCCRLAAPSREGAVLGEWAELGQDVHAADIEGLLDGDDGGILAEHRVEVSKLLAGHLQARGIYLADRVPGAEVEQPWPSTLNLEAAMSMPILDLSL